METRFPELVSLLKTQTYEIEDPEILRHLLLKLFSTQNKEEAERAILNAFQGEEEDED